MSALIELYTPGAADWLDTVDHEWLDTAAHEWGLSGGIIRASVDGVAGVKYWPPWISELDTIQYRTQSIYGGYAALAFGSIAFSPAAFAQFGMWPPASTFIFNLYYAPDSPDDDSTKELITTGTLYLSKLTDRAVQFDVYADSFDANFLTEAQTYDSTTPQPLPIALGAVVHQNPVRLPDAGGGNQVWSKCGLAGAAGVGWHVFDDGVDICANVANETADQFELTVAPVGEVTISGTGTIETLSDLASAVCTILSLSLDEDDARAVSPTLSWFINDQQSAIDLLSDIAASQTHLFYIDASTLYLIDMLAATDMITISNSNGIVDSEYETNPPVFALVHSWVERYVAAAQFINEREKKHTIQTGQYFGPSENVNAFSTVIADIEDALDNFATIQNRNVGRVTIPLSGTLPTPGVLYQIEDSTLAQTLSVALYVRHIAYDFVGHRMILEGDCVLA